MMVSPREWMVFVIDWARDERREGVVRENIGAAWSLSIASWISEGVRGVALGEKDWVGVGG